MDIKERFNRLNRLSRTVGSFDDIRSALVWPSSAQVGYLLLVLVKHNTSDGKPWLTFLYEVKVEGGLQELFAEVLPVAEEIIAKEILTHLDESQESWQRASLFDDRKRYSSRKVTSRLMPAPFSSDFTGTGFALVRWWANRLTIPDRYTVLRKQLGEIAEEYLDRPSDMNRFYALKAFAYLAGDLERNPKPLTYSSQNPLGRTEWSQAVSAVRGMNGNRLHQFRQKRIV